MLFRSCRSRARRDVPHIHPFAAQKSGSVSLPIISYLFAYTTRKTFCISHSIWHGRCSEDGTSVPPVRSVLMKKLICLVAGIALAVLAGSGRPAGAATYTD